MDNIPFINLVEPLNKLFCVQLYQMDRQNRLKQSGQVSEADFSNYVCIFVLFNNRMHLENIWASFNFREYFQLELQQCDINWFGEVLSINNFDGYLF